MSVDLYDDAHVTICRLLGRRHNNPLGDAPWALLERLLRCERPRVLDVGCGRGASSLAWAARGASVIGIDASGAMIAEANRALEAQQGPLDVTFRMGRMEDLDLSEVFDLVLLHDVVCYASERRKVLELALARLRSGGILSLTDYHGDCDLPATRLVSEAWAIGPPWSFEEWERVLQETGAQVLLVADTTRRYREHWVEMRRRLEDRRAEVEEQVGRRAVEGFSSRIGSILSAVDEGAFGHLWAILEARR